jgi:hypothetical protein
VETTDNEYVYTPDPTLVYSGRVSPVGNDSATSHGTADKDQPGKQGITEMDFPGPGTFFVFLPDFIRVPGCAGDHSGYLRAEICVFR